MQTASMHIKRIRDNNGKEKRRKFIIEFLQKNGSIHNHDKFFHAQFESELPGYRRSDKPKRIKPVIAAITELKDMQKEGILDCVENTVNVLRREISRIYTLKTKENQKNEPVSAQKNKPNLALEFELEPEQITEKNQKIQKFEPWNKFAIQIDKIDIQEPPCKSCEFWDPKRIFRKDRLGEFHYNGIRCCHAFTMMHDFSCFKPKKQQIELMK